MALRSLLAGTGIGWTCERFSFLPASSANCGSPLWVSKLVSKAGRLAPQEILELLRGVDLGPSSGREGIEPLLEEVRLLEGMSEGLVEQLGGDLGACQVMGEALLEHVDADFGEAGDALAGFELIAGCSRHLVEMGGPVALAGKVGQRCSVEQATGPRSGALLGARSDCYDEYPICESGAGPEAARVRCNHDHHLVVEAGNGQRSEDIAGEQRSVRVDLVTSGQVELLGAVVSVEGHRSRFWRMTGWPSSPSATSQSDR